MAKCVHEWKEELIGWWICSRCGKDWPRGDAAIHPLEKINVSSKEPTDG